MPPSHEIHVDGHKLVALELNANRTGTPIILLHGVTLSVGFWLTDAVFPEYGPCYALSLPGHYPAILPPGFNEAMLTPESLASLMAQAIRRLVGEQPVILVGHSTGGFLALALAALQPALACGVISLAGFAQGRWIGFYGLQQKLVRLGVMGRLLFKQASNPLRFIRRSIAKGGGWWCMIPGPFLPIPGWAASLTIPMPTPGGLI